MVTTLEPQFEPEGKQCRIEFVEGHLLRTDPDTHYFTALDKADAFARVRKVLGIKGSTTNQNFQQKGVKAIFFGKEQIFPHIKKVEPNKTKRTRGPSPIW